MCWCFKRDVVLSKEPPPCELWCWWKMWLEQNQGHVKRIYGPLEGEWVNRFSGGKFIWITSSVHTAALEPSEHLKINCCKICISHGTGDSDVNPEPQSLCCACWGWRKCQQSDSTGTHNHPHRSVMIRHVIKPFFGVTGHSLLHQSWCFYMMSSPLCVVQVIVLPWSEQCWISSRSASSQDLPLSSAALTFSLSLRW